MNQEVSQVESQELKTFLDDTFDTMEKVLEEQNPELRQYEIGTVQFVGRDIARVSGLPHIRAEELVRFSGNYMGLVFNIDPKEIGVILLDPSENIQVGSEVQRTKRVLDVPVGDGLLGRVVDPLGRPLDGLGEVNTVMRLPVERPAPAVMDRAPVTVPLQTGIKVIDALIPVGRGQRELILGDRMTGKTAIAVDTIINQKETGIISIYCATGKKSADVAKVIAELRDHGVMKSCIVVVATGEDTPGLQFIAPYAATSMGEYFVEQGRDVLIVYDDLTSHARAYREVSLLLRRPPGREAFPGDIFYIHSRLLERSTHMRPELGGGSLTSLPITETEAQDMSSYIPTNLISITDGQIYLSPVLFSKGILPAVDVGKSVSRVGGKTQLPAYRSVAGDLRLSYSQFEELESFSRFGTRLDDATRRTLERGWRVREILKQGQFKPLRASEQIASLLSVTGGALDLVPTEKIREVEARLLETVNEQLPELCTRIEEGKKMDMTDRDSIMNKIKPTIAPFEEIEEAHANN
ncbi:MAG TPA: alternate F1F0 ATPase, F1 subunit alpha [Smithellaceae bacterium]|jgi:F-type H+-transporting ATPase subunit alpha|nr:alternate F1F0 ATPase, F1 subunit alpha [Syntrophaceae bacterium]NMC91207.1 alternate F1F0 ATPase, F1 subunit alpha [Smithella sp.]HNV56849.1 alternate F1F0 ATPase, F1 subunit alpha [Smithellaceae bacterium]MBP8666138.1 alternate F1F0 ATPase, F1 subunit alpha [Syntrophaceae bacterium]MBP9530927.1 alternate F1F0 ATPase, F1 subunit alpha [Syntrophaceae bacterium]